MLVGLFPHAIRHSRSVRGSTTTHACHRRRPPASVEVGRAYFSQPIFRPDRSLFSPVPSPLVPRQWAPGANSLGKWHARQDSNLRPSARRPPVYRGPQTVAEVWGIGYQWRSYFVCRGLSTPPVFLSKKEGIGRRGATSAMTDPDVRRQRSHPTTRPHLVVATSVRVSD